MKNRSSLTALVHAVGRHDPMSRTPARIGESSGPVCVDIVGVDVEPTGHVVPWFMWIASRSLEGDRRRDAVP